MQDNRNKILDFIKRIQHSLFMFFLLTYGVMYLIGIFILKNIYSNFETDFTKGIASQTLDNRVKNISFYQTFSAVTNPQELIRYTSQLNENGANIRSFITTKGAKEIVLDEKTHWANLSWDKIIACAKKEKGCKSNLMRAYDLGLKPPADNFYMNAAILKINNQEYININITSPHKILENHMQNIRSTEHFSQFIILISFLCTIFISYGAVRPMNQFIRRLKQKKLLSANFLYGLPNELNHVRTIRRTIYEALVRKESEEAERNSMQSTLLTLTKEAEIGKIVSQISHDLKSPLILFEEILREDSYENFHHNYDAARRSLNKIMSLVYSLKQADKESLLTRSMGPLALENIIAECRTYANSKGLKFEISFDFSQGHNDSEKIPEFLLDHSKMERSLNNLLRNAVEFAKTTVVFEAHRQNSDLTFAILDDGPGISPEVLPRLFQWRNTGNSETGTGIGLYYAKQICLAHGGDLTYAHENGWTSFTLQIPGACPFPKIQHNLAHDVDDALQGLATPEPENCVAIFLQNKDKFAQFQSFMCEKELPCAFFSELSDSYRNTHFLSLYTDSSEAVLENFIEDGVHIILSKDTDTPEEIYDRLLRFYPSLKKA